MGKVQLDLSKLGVQSTSAPAQNAPSGLDSSTLDLSLLGATVPKKKEDTGLSGLGSSTAGSSSRNQGADTGNLFGKLFRGLNITTNQFYGGVYDVVGSLLSSTAATLDVIRPYNWGADAKIALDAIGSDFKSTGRKISDLLALDSEEANKQSGMDFAQKQKYLKERYTEKTTNKDYGFISSEGGAPKALYELGGFLQNVGDDVSEEAKLDSGIAKEDLNKGVIDLIGEGKYSDAAAVAALGAVRTIPMSMSLAATGGSAKSIFAGSAFMGAGSEIGEAYKDDKKISGDELMRAGWYGFIEGLTESIFRTDINALRNTGKTLISGAPITEAVAEAGADEVKRKLVRGFLPTAKKIFYGAGEEGVEEILSTIGQFMVDKAQSDDQEVTAKELWSLAKRAGDAFIVGSISGGGMSGGLVMATSNALDDTQKKSIKRLQEVVDNQDLSQETRDIAKNKIEDIMKYQERGSYDNYTAIASIEDVEKRSQAIDALYSIEQLKSDKKIAKDETIQSDIDDKIQQKEEFVNKLMDEQALKEYDRQPEALKIKLQEAKIKADEYLAENNSYLAFQEDHASTLEDVNNNKNVEVEVLNKATDQLNEVEQDVVNSQELTPLQKDAILTKIGAQIDSLERYSNATINGAKLSETETEGRRTTTKARAFERARRVRNNRFNGEVFTAFDEAGKPMQVTAQVNERGQISLLPKPKYRVNLETKAAEQVDNSIKIKGELEVIDQEVNEDGDITRVKVRDTKTGKIFETNSPSIIPLLTANKTIREGAYEPDRAYQVDENIENIGSSPIVNKLTKEQRARIKRYHMALKEINPNSRVVIFDNATEVAKELMKRGISRKEAILKSRSSNGMIVGDDIFIDRMSMNDTTIPHEIFHQAFREIAKKDPKLFIQMQNRIMMVLPNEIANKLQKFADSYAEKASEATDEELVEMAEEFLVELGGMMTIGEAKLQRGFMQNVMTAIREVLEKYARKFKLNGLADLINSKLFSEAAEIEELAQFFESLSKSVRQGTRIDTSYIDEQLKRSEEELPDGVSQEIDENAEDGQEINTESLRLQKKGKSLIEELGLKRYPQMNQSIRTKIALKDLGKVKAHLTFSDRLVTGKVGERDYFGGILFASATGSVWASFTRGGVSKIVSGMTMNEDGYRYLMPALLTEEAHMSNKDMLNTSLELVEQAIANKDISAEEANNRIQKVFKKKALAKYGEIYNANLNKITPESVKAALDAAIVASNSTFEDRKSFLESLLGKADINTKLRFGTLPSFGQLANGLAEPITQGLDHGDIALAIRTKGELSIHQPVEGDKDYHPSYPFVVRSTEPVETLVFDHAHNAIDVYPVIKNKQGETRSFEEYQKVYGAQAKPAYLGYMGGRSTMATSVSEIVEEGAQKKGAVPEIKAQKKSTTVYHGGTVQGAKSFNKNNIFFVATDKDEALAYARGNEGNLIQMDIDGSKIASEDEIREILTDLGVADEYMIHELIDPRFEDTYIGKKLTSQLINEIDKRGYEGGAFSDTGIAKSRNAQNMFIVNPAKTLSNNQYVGIQLVNESNADKLYKSGYRPLVNEKVIENATEQELEDLFSKTSNLVADNKLQMVKPSEFEKYNQAQKGEVNISDEIEEFATDGSNMEIEIKSQKRLYHGSPWSFDKFSNTAIGKGEGRQVYGYGMYFSTDKNVAQSYAMSNQGNKLRQLGVLNSLPKKLQTEAYNLLQRQTTTLNDWKSWLEKNKGFLGLNISESNRKKLFQAFGERNLYYVLVDDKANRLDDGFWLDWNQTVGMSKAYRMINGMKETMRTLKSKFNDKDVNNIRIATDSYNIAEAISLSQSSFIGNMTGKQFYEWVTSMYRSSISTKINKFDPQQMASMLLSSVGVDGNRVETFARSGGLGDGQRNYIVFDANAITVLGKETIKVQKKQPSFLSQTLSGHTESEENRRGASIKKAYSNLMQGKFGEAYKGVSQVRFELYRSAYKLSFDRMVNVRKEMENSEFNRSMYLMFNKAGASQFGNFKFEKAFARIYKGLTKEQVTELDAVIFLRRVIAIDENFDNQRVAIQNKLDAIAQIIAQDPSLADSYSAEIAKLKRDLKAKARPKHSSIKWVDKNKPVNKESAEAALEKGKQELGDEAYKELISRSDMYFKEFSNILKYKMDNGLITQETYNMFKDYNYSPRKFLDYAFGIEERDEQGNLTGRILLNANQFHFRGSLLSSDDIKNIEGGSEDFMITDSRQLLQGAMIMAEVKVATNKMVKALANDSELTNQGWVKPMEYEKYNDGTIKTNPDGSYKYLNPSKGFREMIYKVDGKKYAYQLREDLAREFLDEELKDLKGETGSLRRKFNDLGASLSGSRWVKLFATGINAGFFVSNIPVDVISQVNVTDIYAGGIAGQYKQAFGGTIDLSKRLLNMEMGFSDPYVEGLLKEYAQSGGLMMTQTEQGLGVNFKNKLVEYLALFGNISEIASKLNSYRTVKERLMDEYYDKNKMNPTGDDMEAIREEAAYKARAAMDYHRGGLASKMWDQYVPYFNVFSQGAFISWKYIKNNPTVFFDKIAKAGIALSGLTVYNMMVAGADYDNDDVQMDLLNKIVIFMPWKNLDGTRSYWKISVPPIVKGFLNTFQHIGEGSYYKYVSQEPSRQQKWREEVMERWLDGFRPSLATYVGIPTAKAFLEYKFGVDLYRNVPLFYEGKYPVSTSKEGMNEEKVLEFSKLWGKFTGMSPIKTQKAFEDIIPAYNPLVQMGYHILDKAIDSANPLLPDGVQLKEYQRSKYGKETLTNVPLSFITGIKDRLVDKTDPTVKYMKDRERSLEIDEKRGDVYYDLKAEMKSFVKEGGDSKVLIEKIKDRPVMEQKFAINYFFMLQKRDMLNYPDQFDEYSNIMFSADPKAKAEKLYERGGTTNYLNPQNEKETKEANDLMMLKILDAPTMLEYQNYFKPTSGQTSENK